LCVCAAVTALSIGARPLRGQDSTFALLDRAVRLYGSGTTVRAKLDQTLINPAAKTTRSAKGELFQDARKRFALRFTEPAADAIVNDGKALWVYLPSTMPGQVMKLPLQAGGTFDFLSQLLQAPRKSYDVTLRPDTTVGSRTVSVYALLPKRLNGTPFLRATLWIGVNDAKLWMLETVEPSGLVRRVQFTTMTLGAALPRGVLTFTPPEGARVVDPQAMMGGASALPPNPTKAKKVP
jgi:outer membrane lipoprotein carrier protein